MEEERRTEGWAEAKRQQLHRRAVVASLRLPACRTFRLPAARSSPNYPSAPASLLKGTDLGRFVGLSAQMGMLNEAIYIAAAMNCPRPPFKMANPLVHTDCDVYNKLMTDTFVSKFELDNGVDSEIFQVFGAMLRWEKEVSHSEEGESSALSPDKFCRKYSVAFNRMSPLMQTKKNLQERISLILKVDRGKVR